LRFCQQHPPATLLDRLVAAGADPAWVGCRDAMKIDKRALIV
jgi:hypothetical protein